MDILNKCIVIGYEHHNSLGQVRSLGEYGIKPIVIMINSKVRITSASKYVSEKYYVDNLNEAYDLLIKKWGNEKLKPFIFTSDDIATSYFDKKYDDIKDLFYFNNCGKQGAITSFMDKIQMYQIAESVGFLVPKAFSLNDVDFKKLNYPVITKTETSLHDNWKDNSFVCHNEEELLKALNKISTNNEHIVIQKYIDKENEICLEGYAYNDGKNVVIPVSLSMKYLIEGAYGHYLSAVNFNDSDLFNKTSKLISIFKYNGVFEIEFLQDKSEELYFLEINFRNSAWGYVTTKVGMSTAVGWIKSQLEGNNHKPIVLPIKKDFTAMSEFSDFKVRVMHKKIKFNEWKKQFKTCDCTFYYDKKDKKPFRHALINKFFKTIF